MSANSLSQNIGGGILISASDYDFAKTKVYIFPKKQICFDLGTIRNMNGQVSVRTKTDSTSPSDHPEIFTASGGINGLTVRILENISGYNEKNKIGN